MKTYDWYLIFNRQEFSALDLISKTYTHNLSGRGVQSFLVTRGNTIAITYDGAFLPIELNGKNPYESEGYAIFLDSDENVWLGFEVNE